MSVLSQPELHGRPTHTFMIPTLGMRMRQGDSKFEASLDSARKPALAFVSGQTLLSKNWIEPERSAVCTAPGRADPDPCERSRQVTAARPRGGASLSGPAPRPRARGRASGHVTAAQVSSASGSGFGVAAGSRFHSLGCAGDYGVLLRPSHHRTRGCWRPRPRIRLCLQNQEEAFRAAESEGVPGRRPAGGRVPVGRRPLGKNRPGTPAPAPRPGSPGSGVQSSSRCHLSPAPVPSAPFPGVPQAVFWL